MTGLVARAAASAVGTLVSAIASRAGRGGNAFAKALSAAGADGAAPTASANLIRQQLLLQHARKIGALSQEMLSLPVTSSEARRIATGLWALVEGIKNGSSPADADALERQLDEFVAEIAGEYSLSADDASRLSEIVRDYARENIGTDGESAAA